MLYPEQKKEIIDGVSYNYLCHIQYVNGAGNVYPAHFHSYIEILYGVVGSYEIFLNGKGHHFSSGDLVIINSKEVHQIDSLSNAAGEYIVLRFEPEVIYNSMFANYSQFKYVFPFMLENSQHQKVIPASEISETFIPDLLYDMLEEFSTRQYGYELAIKNHIGRIFLWLLRYFHHKGSDFITLPDSALEHLQAAFNYIELHYDEPLTVPELASLCNMSPNYFSRTFNLQMGMNVNEYINYIRISAAEKLLISTTMNITEISTAVGFNTTSYFIKLFKSYKHISPKQFRKEIVVS